MSVSLISLILEIADDFPILSHLHFTASKQKRIMASNKDPSKAKESSMEEVASQENRKFASKNKCRGSRELKDMTVETFCPKDSSSEITPTEIFEGVSKNKKSSEPSLSTSNESIKVDSNPKPVSIVKPTKTKVADKRQNQSGKKTKPELSPKEKPKPKSGDDKNKTDGETPSPQKADKNLGMEKTTVIPVEVITQDSQTEKTGVDDSITIVDTDKRNRVHHLLPVPFSSGNHFVEVTKGLLHLYKENQRTTLAEEAERSEMICILAVPAAMTTHDLLQFIAPVYDDVEHIRIIKENKPNLYMVLLKFKNQYSADLFYKNFNGERFNTIEPEVCHLAFVAKVETIRDSEVACFPLPGTTELPTCPVCLEKMDESVEGILTILCNHSFHGSCLAKWGDTSCPVCRYSQTPELMPDNRCVECGSQDSLWICLICGHIGCGRYVDGHAYQHYLDTQHTYAMQLGNNRVWDYAGDNYVHRLIQNKADGKPVELEPLWVENEEKMDSMQLEYTYLLTSQLEAQRHYFEDRLTRIETDALKQLEEMKEKTKHAVDERKQLEEKLNRVTKEKQALDKKITQLSAKLNKLASEFKDEKEMNKSLMQNQASWQYKLTAAEKSVKEKDKEILDLQDQLRDLMFYFDAKEKLQDVPDVSREEIQESQIVIGEASGTSETTKSRKKKNR